MTSSAPFPGEPTLDELANPSQGFFVKLEGGHVRGMVPSFYKEHPNPHEIIVKHKGVPIESCGGPFTVAQVPIERRWAIMPDGEVMGDLEFRDHHIRWYEEYFRELARENPDLQNIDGGNPACDIPDPRRYVAVQVDRTNPKRFVPANYDPHKTEGARSKQFYTKDGDPVDEERIQVLCNAYANPKLRKALKPHEIEEVENTLGITSSGGANEITTKLELLNSMLAVGDLTQEQHSRQVALLTGAPVPDAVVEPESADEPQGETTAETTVNPDSPPTFTAKASCGKEFTKNSKNGALGAVRFHQQKCKACKELIE